MAGPSGGESILGKRAAAEGSPFTEERAPKRFRHLPATPVAPGLRPLSITVNYDNLLTDAIALDGYSDASVDEKLGIACVAWTIGFYEGAR